MLLEARDAITKGGWNDCGGVLGLCLGVGAQETPEKAAQISDQAWLAIVDGARYAQSWEQASVMFRSAIAEERWAKAVEGVRGPLGKVETRTLIAATYTRTLPGAPDGEYVVAQFRTSFEHKKDAIETVTSVREKDGSWRLAGYFIK